MRSNTRRFGLADFKLVVHYKDPSYDVSHAVVAESLAAAQSMCEEIMRSYKERMESMERLNVFASSVAVGCSACPSSENQVKFVDYYGDLILPPRDI